MLKRLLTAFLLIPAAAFGQQTRMVAPIVVTDYQMDSIRIANDVDARCKNVRSGKIRYKMISEHFFKSHPREEDHVFEFSYPSAVNDTIHFAAELDRRKTFLNDEILFYHDSLFDVDHEQKVIFYEKKNTETFLDDYDMEIWMYSYGIFPRTAHDLFSIKGQYSFGDTIIDGDTCGMITIKKPRDWVSLDTIEKVFVISKNIDVHSSYSTTMIGHCDNNSSYTQLCKSTEFSASPDPLLEPRMTGYIYGLLRDSGYSIYPYEKAPEYHSQKNKYQRLKDGDTFPITNFQTMDGTPVIFPADHQKLRCWIFPL